MFLSGWTLSRLGRARAGALEIWPGVLAQGLTFANLFVPIAFGAQEQLVALVQSTAIAAILVQTVTHAIPGRLPAIGNNLQARHLRISALFSSLSISLLLAILGVILTLTQHRGTSIVLGGSIVLAAQSYYTVYTSELTRQDNYGGILRARLAYAVPLILLTGLVSLIHVEGFWLAVAAAASFFSGGMAAAAASRRSSGKERQARQNGAINRYFAELRVAAPLAFAYLLGGFSGQAGALALVGMGQFQPAWAVVVRIMNGMQTVGGQFLAPRADIDVGRSLRSSDAAGLGRGLKRAVAVGAVLAFGTVVLAGLALAYSGIQVSDLLTDGGLLVALLGYAGATTGITVIGRILGLVGRHWVRLVWEVARAVGFGAIILLARGELLLIALGILGFMSAATYTLLCVHAFRRYLLVERSTDAEVES